MSLYAPMTTGAEFEYFEVPPISETIALIGNSERKCALQLLADPGETVLATELNSRLNWAQDPASDVTFKATAQLLKDAHVEAGTFIPTEPPTKNTVREVLKPIDSSLNDAAAGHLLGLSAHYGVSLRRFLGANHAPAGSLRAPQNVLLLADFFAARAAGERSAVTIDELAAASGVERHAVINNIKRLRANGYVEYDTTTIWDEVARFSIEPGADVHSSDTTLSGTPRISQKTRHAGVPTYQTEITTALERFQQRGVESFTYEDLMRELGSRYEELHETQLYGPVQALAREGILRRLHFTSTYGDPFSSIYCTPAQKAIFDRTSAIYTGLAANDPEVIAEGLEIGREIMGDGALVRTLMQRSYNSSSAPNRDWHEARAAVVRLALMGGIERSTAEILDHFEEGTFTTAALGRVLRRMRDAGELTVRKEGTSKIWAASRKTT